MRFEKRIIIKQTNILLKSDSKESFENAEKRIKADRFFLENFIKKHPLFLASLHPISLEMLGEIDAPEIIKIMIEASKIANVGPMASVAGAIAERACIAMVEAGAKKAIAENGGDIHAHAGEWVVGINESSKSRISRIAFRLRNSEMPIAICSSSGSFGHSISFGNADLVIAIAKKASIADACATAIANEVKLSKSEEDAIQKALEKADEIKELRACLVIVGELVGKKGRLPELVYVENSLKGI